MAPSDSGQLMLDFAPPKERQPWVPADLVGHRTREFDTGRQQWRAWEHNPDCHVCDGYGNYGSDRTWGRTLRRTEVACPCGGWADELDLWATDEVARLILARRAIFAERAQTKEATDGVA